MSFSRSINVNVCWTGRRSQGSQKLLTIVRRDIDEDTSAHRYILFEAGIPIAHSAKTEGDGAEMFAAFLEIVMRVLGAQPLLPAETLAAA